jgi:GcrA cell cycle regulator
MKPPNWWTEDRVTELRTRYTAGETYGEIGRAMHAVSRNAVIGKAHRLGLFGRRPRPAAKQPNGHRNEPRKTVHYVDGRLFMVHDKGDDVSEPEPIQFANPKSMLELTQCDCRYPGAGSGADMLYCGAPTVNGHSYCLAHCRIAYAGRVRAPRS